MKLADLEEMQDGAWRAFERAVTADDARLADPALSRFSALSNAVFLERAAVQMADQSYSLARIATAMAEVAVLSRPSPYKAAEGGL